MINISCPKYQLLDWQPYFYYILQVQNNTEWILKHHPILLETSCVASVGLLKRKCSEASLFSKTITQLLFINTVDTEIKYTKDMGVWAVRMSQSTDYFLKCIHQNFPSHSIYSSAQRQNRRVHKRNWVRNLGLEMKAVL
jgi:hypothetical protein